MSNIDGPQNIRQETYADPAVVVVSEPAVAARPAVVAPVVQQPVVQQPVACRRNRPGFGASRPMQ